jgi:hypothetical protein
MGFTRFLLTRNAVLGEDAMFSWLACRNRDAEALFYGCVGKSPNRMIFLKGGERNSIRSGGSKDSQAPTRAFNDSFLEQREV